MTKLPAEAMARLPAPVEKAMITYASKPLPDR